LKKLFSLFIAIALVLGGLLAFAPQVSLAELSLYDIASYHTDIEISNNNTYHVTEKILVDFHLARHGILRAIPYVQRMAWEENGATQNVIYRTDIEQVQVLNDPFETYREGGDLIIQIGDPDVYQSGQKEYNIAYNHILGDDKVNSQDFVYYDLVGTEWDCNVQDVSFAVTLPGGFDPEKIWFFTGSYGSTEKAAVQYSVNGNTISGSLDGVLEPGEGLTLQIDLPEGYFDVPPAFPWNEVLIVLALIFTIISLLLFLLFGRDGRLVTPVEFYAPEGITSAEAGYIIDTMSDDKDVVSLVLYWASQGYLSIDRVGEKDFELTKQKDLQSDAYSYEKHMFEQLFYNRNSVKISQLKKTFYTTIDTTKELLADHYATKENRLYSTNSKAFGSLIRFLMGLLVGFSAAVASYEATYSIAFAAVMAVICMVLVILSFAILRRTILRWRAIRVAKRSAMLFIGIIIVLLVMVGYMVYMTVQGMTMVGMAIAAMTLLTGGISLFMRKRTKRGNELLGRLLGFKNFLERAEKDHIERLVEENPAYFYNVMPYAYVLGVTDKWAKNFEGMALRPPDWYHDSYGPADPFSPLVFQAAMFRSMMIMRSNMAYRPAPQGNSNSGFGGGFGGGSFGGGGFSGGGFGGGGGRSW